MPISFRADQSRSLSLVSPLRSIFDGLGQSLIDVILRQRPQFEAINNMLLDMLAAVARKDFDDRRRRASTRSGQGRGSYKGRAEDVERNAGIASMIEAGASWSAIQAATGCSRAKIAKRAKQAA